MRSGGFFGDRTGAEARQSIPSKFSDMANRSNHMPIQLNRKSQRDRALFKHWDRLDDRLFERIPRARLKAAQLALQGYFVLPGDPAYDTDRKLSNPVFNA